MKERLNKFIDVIYNSFKKAQYLIKESLIKINHRVDAITNKSKLINSSYNPLINKKQTLEKSLLSELNSLKETDNKLQVQIKEYKIQNNSLKTDIEALQEILFSK